MDTDLWAKFLEFQNTYKPPPGVDKSFVIDSSTFFSDAMRDELEARRNSYFVSVASQLHLHDPGKSQDEWLVEVVSLLENYIFSYHLNEVMMEFNKHHILGLEVLLKNAPPSPHDIKVFRGENHHTHYAPGDEVEFSAFLSSSDEWKVAKRFHGINRGYMLALNIPAGTPMLYKTASPMHQVQGHARV